jgi:hypothetical protein
MNTLNNNNQENTMTEHTAPEGAINRYRVVRVSTGSITEVAYVTARDEEEAEEKSENEEEEAEEFDPERKSHESDSESTESEEEGRLNELLMATGQESRKRK